ncbi:MAG: serine hydrolase [Bacillota bacterium]
MRMTDPSWSLFEERFAQLAENEKVPGVALAVAREGELEYFLGYGHRDLARGLPVTLDTVFGVASVTKSVTCLAIMQLVDRGKVDVTDPIVKWLPEFRAPNPEWSRQITVHHLMSHSSGLPGLPCLFGARADSIVKDPNRARLGFTDESFNVPRVQTYEDLLRVMAETDYALLGQPGAQFNYSNEGFALLQGVIERASGQDFLSYAQANILDPIGMTHSTFLAADLGRFPEVTELYAPVLKDGGRKEVFHAPVWWDVAGIYTNGSLKSSARDLLRYLDVYRTGGLAGGLRIVSEEGIGRMMTPHVQTPAGTFYGYGLMVSPTRHGFAVVHHGGSIKGVASHVAVAPERGLAVVTLANLNGFVSEKVGFMALETAAGLPPKALSREFPDFPLDAAALAAYPGEYRSGEGDSASVSVEDDHLIITLDGMRYDVQPYGPDSFVWPEGEKPFIFLRGKNGDITALFVGVRVLPRVAV